MMRWDPPSKARKDCGFTDTSIGRYRIVSIMRGKKFLLRLNGQAVGILTSPEELRRLAETDYLQRTGATSDD